MATKQITLEIDADTAEAFEKMPQGGKKTIERLLGLRLQSLVAHANESLSDVMDELGRTAQERGLTPETLESILNEE